VCDLETSRIGAPYIYDISNLRVKSKSHVLWPRLDHLTSGRRLRHVSKNVSALSQTALVVKYRKPVTDLHHVTNYRHNALELLHILHLRHD
jgi:hypothetical protein